MAKKKKRILKQDNRPEKQSRSTEKQKHYTGGNKIAFAQGVLRKMSFGLLLVLPFINGKTFIVTSAPKYFMSAVFVLLAAAFALIGLSNGRLSWPKHPWAKFVSFFIAAISLATIFSIDPRASFWGIYPYFHTGLQMILISSLFCYIVLIGNPSKKDIVDLLFYLVIVGGTIGMLAIFEHFSLFGLGSATSYARANGIFKNADYTFSFLIFILPLSCYFLERSKSLLRPFLSLVSFVLILFGLFFLAPEGLQVIINNLVFSWAGLALLGVIVAVSLTWHFAGRNKVEVAQDIIKQRQKPLLLLLVVLFGLIGLFLAKGSAKDFLNDPSNSQRFWAWRAGIQNGLDHLWLGTGPSTVPYFLPTIRDKVPFDDWNDNNITGSLHNEPIDYFAASGAIGLIAYLLLWGSIFYFAVKGIRHVSENRRLILSLTVALAFFLGFNLFFFTVVNTMFLPWIAAAFILILSNNVSYTSCADSTVFKGWIRGLAYVLSGIFTLASLVFVSYWIADYYLGKGFKTNNSDYYKKAATLFPFNDAYLMRHSNANIVAMAQGIDVNDVSAVESMKPELESTIQLAQRAVDIRPLGHANWINYGAVSLFLEKVDDTYIGQADQHFQKALDLRPKSEIAHLEIAMSYWRAGDRDRAIDYAKKATALANKHTIGRCSGILGQYYYTDEQFDKALEAFKAAKDYLRGRDKQMVEEYIQELESKRENQI